MKIKLKISEISKTKKSQPLQNQPFVLTKQMLRKKKCTTKKYMCRMCFKMCMSVHEFNLHVQKHVPKCVDCKVTFRSWSVFDTHAPHCIKIQNKIGGKNRMPEIRMQEKTMPQVKVAKLPFGCNRCGKKYEKFEKLIDHQINRFRRLDWENV